MTDLPYRRFEHLYQGIWPQQEASVSDQTPPIAHFPDRYDQSQDARLADLEHRLSMLASASLANTTLIQSLEARITRLDEDNRSRDEEITDRIAALEAALIGGANAFHTAVARALICEPDPQPPREAPPEAPGTPTLITPVS